MRNPEDLQAEQIEFGIELETAIPATSRIAVGPYHAGSTVSAGRHAVTGAAIAAPVLSNGNRWRADQDGSIRTEPGELKCEFVSPILKGREGIEKLVEFIAFAKAVGAKANASCGCHITVGVKSVIGHPSENQIVNFIRKLSRLVHRHAWAIYAQTGTNRHVNAYSLPLKSDAGAVTNELKSDYSMPRAQKIQNLNHLGRGIMNCQKAMPPDLSKSCVEFRAFAGTLNEAKVLHHVATVFGLCRRAHTTRHVPPFHRPDFRPAPDAPSALFRLWEFLGWDDDKSGPDVAFGQFGLLHSRFPDYKDKALAMAMKFEDKYPKAFADPRKNHPVIPQPADGPPF